jgi:hypothetical protein
MPTPASVASLSSERDDYGHMLRRIRHILEHDELSIALRFSFERDARDFERLLSKATTKLERAICVEVAPSLRYGFR